MRRFAAALASALLLSACGSPFTGSPDSDTLHVDVYAASSLTDVFTPLAEVYESQSPGVDVRLTFAGSAELAAQIAEGAPADVFASANERQMANVSEYAYGDPQTFASNSLTIVVPTGNPGGVTDLASLARPDLTVVLCAPEVPCGAATLALQVAEGVTLSPASELSNVTDVLGTVASGEADAGLVYVTDVARAEGVEEIPLTDATSPTTAYPIAVMTTGDARVAAQGFVDFVLGQRGQEMLAAAGFASPRSAGER